MLIITRKVGESLIIDDNIEITISKVYDGNVKIGIEAPKNISILRKEIYDQVKNENREAQKIDISMLKSVKSKK